MNIISKITRVYITTTDKEYYYYICEKAMQQYFTDDYPVDWFKDDYPVDWFKTMSEAELKENPLDLSGVDFVNLVYVGK